MNELNPLLSKVRLPGETYQLPSQGLFYTNNELDESVQKGEVEIFPLTTLDEIILNTPDKLLSGKAIYEVFARCIPQIKNPMNILAKDVDFLLICLRLVTFGPHMEVPYQHTCDDAKEHTYKVDLQKLIRSTKKIDPLLMSKEYTKTLSNGQTIVIQPLRYCDVIRMYEMTALNKDTDLDQTEIENNVIKMIASVIESVDKINDPVFIEEWVRVLPLNIKRDIERVVNNISDWGLDFSTIHVKCKDCGQDMLLPITANPVSFFFQR